MLVDKTNFGLVIYNHANFYRFEETSSYWAVKRISVFLCFSLVNQGHTSGNTVYNRTVTNIESTVRAMHSCDSWLNSFLLENFLYVCMYFLRLLLGFCQVPERYKNLPPYKHIKHEKRRTYCGKNDIKKRQHYF